MEDVVIKIGASSKQFQEEFDKIRKTTEDFRDHVKSVTEVAGVAFAGFSATIAGCVLKFNEQQQADLKLEAVLRSTGGVAGQTAESILRTAQALEQTTVFSEDTIRETQTVMLQFTNIGENVFPQATKAILDYAAGAGIDATSAAFQLGKALNEPTQGMMRLQREGIQFTESQQAQIKVMEMSGDVLGAQRIILEGVERAHGGMAEAAAQGAGQLKKLSQQAQELAEDIGAHLAPMVDAAAGHLADFIKWVREHEEVARLGAVVLTAGAAVSGLVLAGGAATLMFLKFEAALIASNASIGATTLAVRGLVGATGLGLIIIVGAEVAMHWDSIWPRMRAVFEGFVTAVTGSLKGLKDVLTGVFTLDRDKIAEGLAEVALAMKSGWTEATQASLKTVQDGNRDIAKENDSARADAMAKNKAAILEQQRIDAERKALQYKSLQAHNAAMLLEYQNATSELVALKNKEGDLLKTIADATGVKELASVRAAAQARLAAVRELYENASSVEKTRRDLDSQIRLASYTHESQAIVDIKKKEQQAYSALVDKENVAIRDKIKAYLLELQMMYDIAAKNEAQKKEKFLKETLKDNQAFQNLDKQEKAHFLKENQNDLIASMQTESESREAHAKDELGKQIQHDNDWLNNQREFGKGYALLVGIMHSDIFQKTQSAFSDLEQLTQSSNQTLKSVGKAAAAANIIYKTYESALNVFAGFSTIPFIGPELGYAAAAAVTAWGFEQLGRVNSMAQGGLVTGGTAGRDSVPIMAMPGELVAPTHNFEEVIGSVAAQRAAQKMGAPMGGSAGGPLDVRISFHGQASRMLTAQINQDKALGRHRGRA